MWRKLPGSRSAGRVQSVALRLVCEREAEIEAFKAREYWTIEVEFPTEAGERFTARLSHLDGKKLDRFDLDSEAKARAAADAILDAGRLHGRRGRAREVRRNPFPPFTTSTLQQEASRKLGFGASRTMRIAQRLYEGVDLDGETVGLITYMRTDGVAIAGEAIAAARQLIGERFRRALSAGRAAGLSQPGQERAGSARGDPPDRSRAASPGDVARHLDDDQRRLYELIWKRTVASQMESAVLDQVSVDIAEPSGRLRLRATGSVVVFDGFLKLYQEDRDDAAEEEEGRPPADHAREASASSAARSPRSSISPSRRRAIPRRASSRSSKNSASAAPRPMPRSCRCCRTATMCGSTSAASFRRTAAASSPRS